MEMDVNKLITSVRERPSLWDRADKAYHNRDIIRDLWHEVCLELDLDLSEIEGVKKRWNSLRDVFRREYNKNYRSQNSSSTWLYYDAMCFLLPQMKPPRQVTVEVVEPTDYDTYETSSYVGLEESHEEITLEPKFSGHILLGEKRSLRDPFDFANERQLPRKIFHAQDMAAYSKSEESSDYHFLMSLLPFLKDLPAAKKMSVRMKMMQVLEAEVSIQEPSTSSSTTRSSKSNANETNSSESILYNVEMERKSPD